MSPRGRRQGQATELDQQEKGDASGQRFKKASPSVARPCGCRSTKRVVPAVAAAKCARRVVPVWSVHAANGASLADYAGTLQEGGGLAPSEGRAG